MQKLTIVKTPTNYAIVPIYASVFPETTARKSQQ